MSRLVALICLALIWTLLTTDLPNAAESEGRNAEPFLPLLKKGGSEVAGTSMQATQGKRVNTPKRPKHVPQRTCIACHQVKPKRELLRIVRTPDGHVEMDPTGKKSGRGAYLCATRSCWTTALKKNRLEQELETTISEEDRAALESYMATLPASEAPPRVGAAAPDRAP